VAPTALGETVGRMTAFAKILRDWVPASLDWLAKAQRRDGGWSYFADGDSAIEPTAMAVAALHALDVEPHAWQRGLEFLISMQADGGALRPQPSQPEATALSALAAVVMVRCGGDVTVAGQVADALKSWTPRTMERNAAIGNDPTLRGFAWTPRTFSWVEPTAYGVMLFDALGRGDDPRIAESRALLVDRAVPTGGWNYGNPSVLGAVLEADPQTSAVALLALLDDPARRQVGMGAAFLQAQARSITSALTRAWVAIALRAVGDETTVDLAGFGPLLKDGFASPRSPWHHAAALLAVAPLDRIPFVPGSPP